MGITVRVSSSCEAGISGRSAARSAGSNVAVRTGLAKLQKCPSLLLLAAAPVLWLGAVLPLIDATAALAMVTALLAALCWPAAILMIRDDKARAGRSSAEELMLAVIIRLDATGEALDVAGAAGPLIGVPGELLLGGGLVERILLADRAGFLLAAGSLCSTDPRQIVRVRLRVTTAGQTTVDHRPFVAEMLHTGDASEPVLAILREDCMIADEIGAQAPNGNATADSDIATTQLLAAISHELKTPLGAMMGFADALAGGLPVRFGQARHVEYAGLIREAGAHAVAVIDAMASVARVERDAPSPCETIDLAAAIELCRRMTEAAAAKNLVTIRTALASDVSHYSGDRSAVQQILLNLLSNAVKFTPAGGQVAVTARHRADRIEIRVSDTGIGIAADDLPHLGEPFVRLRNEATRDCEGTGLGLALVKRLVARQGGALTIESAPGRGTTVTVALPQRRDAATTRNWLATEAIGASADRDREFGHGPFRKAG